MGRILAIDFGTKRVGLAVTDPLKMIASRLNTLHSNELMGFLTKYMAENEVEEIVVGRPVDLRNKETHATKLSDDFCKHLKRTFPSTSIMRVDERFTSKIAFKTMIDSGLGKKQRSNKELVDGVSATLILQHYLETISK